MSNFVLQDGVAAKWLTFAMDRPNVDWKDSLPVPAYASSVSAALLFIHVLVKRLVSRSISSNGMTTGTNSLASMAKAQIEGHGGIVIWTSEVVRLLGCAALAGLSLILSRKDHSEAADSHNPMLWLPFAFIYQTLLAFSVVTLPRGFAHPVFKLNLTVHLALDWIVLAIRDLAPRCTFHGSPVDDANGGVLWALIATLTVVGVIMPLITPRHYIPVDPTDAKAPSPQQIASPLSILLFSWLDGLVWRATQVEHLPMEELPALPDSSQASILSRSAFSNIDPFVGDTVLPTKRRYIFWGLLRTYRTDYILIAISMVLQTVAALTSPLALNKLLKYLENGENAEVRPWVWVILLFVAPGVNSILSQQYYRLYTRVMVHLEAVLTQLILQHALRIRMVAEPEGGAVDSTPTPTPSTIATATKLPSTDGDERDVPEGEETTLAESSNASTTATTVVPPAASDAKSTNLVGKMNNLISSDLKAIGEAAEFMQPFVLGPCLIVGCVVFLYIILGWSAFVGFAGMILQLPVPIWMAKMLRSTTKMVTKKSDSRVDAATETMSVVRMIKLFGWEAKMSAQLDKKREEELKWVWKSRMYDMAILNANIMLPMLTMLLTFATYTMVLRRPLDAATVFTALTVFEILQNQVRHVFYYVPAVIKGKVSLDRIDDFINNTELLDVYTPESEASITLGSQETSDDIGFRSARFSWSVEPDSGAVTPSKRRFRLNIEDELLFKRGKVNLIVGPTGSGKTSMLMALLDALHAIFPQLMINLPRAGGVAYAAQESWVLNETIKNNIVFGATFDEERYKKVIHQCGLTRDLSLFDAGDGTEVGEKGLTLNGGQKARVTLARAIYSSAEILILDDVLSALDVHTSRWILEKCFLGDLVKGRTLIMVTHNVSLAGPHADFVVSLGSDGRVLAQGSFSEVLSHNDKLRRAVSENLKEVEKADQEVDSNDPDEVKTTSDGKLVVEEESGIGHISWASLKMYFAAFGGRWPTLFWVAFWFATFFECIVEVFQPWFLGQWATQYEDHTPEEVNVPFYLGGYAFLVILMLFVFTIAQIGLALGTVSSARTLHKRLIDNVLGTTLRWLDKTPTSRVITRCTQDISSIDSRIPEILSGLFEVTVLIIVRFFAIIILTPIFGFMGLVVMGLGIMLGHLYIRARLSVKREQDKAKSPVMDAPLILNGVVSIRAYGAQAKFKLNPMKKIDNYTRAALINWDLNRWITIRVDALGNLFSSCLAAYFVYGSEKVSAANSGFELSLAVFFGTLVLWWVRTVNMFETQGNSIERLYQYMVIEQEYKPTADGVPPAYWPSSGSLRVEKLSARYSEVNILRIVDMHLILSSRMGLVCSTILILDEATSAIDYKTDAIIQESLRHELKKGVTVITVAHRLKTIMDADRIMVLDAGHIVEFASPKELLKNPSGFFRSLVDESGDKDALYTAAGV
ncbi:hypothetical protein M422DRAFT_247819 [Sphaerobolus stellatus SS14]|nr:hypothetical protein M422DRAFT_247819 [Sphaerobolus stellatus SS14]